MFLRALLFPPLTSRGRFLLHKSIEEYFPSLTTFSVGQEPRRQTLVTWSSVVEKRRKQREENDQEKLSERTLIEKSLVALTTERSLCIGSVPDEVAGACSLLLEKSTAKGTAVPAAAGAVACITSPCKVLAGNKRSSDDVSGVLEWRKNKEPIENQREQSSERLTHVIEVTGDSIRKGTERLAESSCSESAVQVSPHNWATIESELIKDCNESGSKHNLHFISSHKRMPTTTMVTETDSGNNRRRSKAPAAIYRPPPARKLKTNNCQKLTENIPNYGGDSQRQQYLEALKEYQHNNINLYNNKFSTYDNSYSNKEILDDHKDLDSLQRSRRPDQQFYVPKRRSHDKYGAVQNCEDIHTNRPPSPTNSVCSVASEFSGRNRYSRQHHIMSLQEDNDTRLMRKPPFLTPPANIDKPRPKQSLFTCETLQLIERCINKDVNGTTPNNKAPVNGKNFYSEPNYPRDRTKHPVHCKENLHHSETPKRSRRSRNHRKGQSISRDSSADSRIVNNNLNFHSSNIAHDYERYSHSYDNLNVRCSSQVSSRNPSLERPMTDSPSSGYEWRVRDSPSKLSPPCYNVQIPSRKLSTGKNGSVTNIYEDLKRNRKHSYSNENSLPPTGYSIENRVNTRLGQQRSPREIDMDVNVKHENGDEQDVELYNGSTIVIKSSNSHSDSQLMESALEKKPNYIYEPVSPTYIENIDVSLLDSNLINNKPLIDANYPTPTNSPNIASCDSYTCSINNTDDSSTSSYSSPPTSPSLPRDSSPKFPTPPLSQDDDRYCFLEENPISKEEPSKSSEINICDNMLDSTHLNEKKEGLNSAEINEEHLEEKPIIPISKEEFICTVPSVHNLSLNDSFLSSESETLAESSIENETPQENENPKKFSFCWADEAVEGKEDSWDTLYDDSGNCLDSAVKRQLSDAIGNIVLEKPSNDYYEFKPEEPVINDEDYGHVVEIYDFPVSFKTQDLMVIFQEFKSFDLKWVDDTHALGIFATSLQAADSLSMQHPFVKTRPLTLAIAASKSKALRLTDAHLPYKPRPATSVALARRLVSGALGLKVSISKEQRDAEKNKLKHAKEQKRLIARQKEEAWEGTLGNVS